MKLCFSLSLSLLFYFLSFDLFAFLLNFLSHIFFHQRCHSHTLTKNQFIQTFSLFSLSLSLSFFYYFPSIFFLSFSFSILSPFLCFSLSFMLLLFWLFLFIFLPFSLLFLCHSLTKFIVYELFSKSRNKQQKVFPSNNPFFLM